MTFNHQNEGSNPSSPNQKFGNKNDRNLNIRTFSNKKLEFLVII